MNVTQSILLGIVQGLTEFLPVSSSGHLVIVGKLSGVTPDITYTVMLHFASFLAVLIFFYKEILAIITGVFKRDQQKLAYVGQIIVAITPVVIAALIFEDYIESSFSSLKVVGGFLIITAAILFFGERVAKSNKQLTFKNSLIIGIAQIATLFPGISRSGTTISTGLALGLNRKEAVAFSFIMALPLIFGATILKIGDMETLLTTASLSGFISAFITSYLAIDFMFARIKNFNIFAAYTLIAGTSCLFL